MNFAIISPTAGLDKYATLSKTHLVLAQVTDPAYANFYRLRRKMGDTLILDNGAHEQGRAVNWDTLQLALYGYQPQICVLPDTLNHPLHTASDGLRFLDLAARKFPEIEWMYVPQARDNDLHAEVLMSVLHDRRVGHLIKWLGITRYLTLTNEMPRPLVLDYLKNTPGLTDLKYHALGMCNGSIQELHSLAEAGFDSVDSSVPVWRGWNGFAVEDARTWPEIPVDFTAPLSQNDSLIQFNIRRCLEAANADTTNLRRNDAGAGV